MSTPPELRLPEADDLKQRYMASSHIHWEKFCESEGLNPAIRSAYPILLWRDEKRKAIAQKEAEQLAEMLFDRRFKWHKDVLKTLREYPESCDIMHQLIRAKMQLMVQDLNDDIKNKDKSPEEYKPKFKNVKTSDMFMLASALKQTTETKHKSLLLNDWTAKGAESETVRDTEREVEEQGSGFKIEVIGKEGGMNAKDIEQMMSNYIDQLKTN